MANLLDTDTTGQKVTHKSVLALHDLGVMIKLWGSAKDVYSSHVEKRHIETQKRKGKKPGLLSGTQWVETLSLKEHFFLTFPACF